MAGQDALPSNSIQNNEAHQWLSAKGYAHPALLQQEWVSLTFPSSWRKCFLLLIIEYNISCGLVIDWFYHVDCVPCVVTFEIFLKIINECWMLSKAFSSSIETIIYYFCSLISYCSVSYWLICGNWIYSSWNSPSQNTGVGSLSLLQWIFLTQESNWGLLHCRWILY